jgi:hypothetical protein
VACAVRQGAVCLWARPVVSWPAGGGNGCGAPVAHAVERRVRRLLPRLRLSVFGQEQPLDLTSARCSDAIGRPCDADARVLAELLVTRRPLRFGRSRSPGRGTWFREFTSAPGSVVVLSLYLDSAHKAFLRVRPRGLTAFFICALSWQAEKHGNYQLDR